LTLGGGIGWLVRKYGLACDNLLAAEVELANGESVRVSDDQYADLFFALRGGGARLGVVTEFAFRLHPVSTVLAGGLWCKAERAREVLRAFREFATQVPDELTMMASATIAPTDPLVPPELHGKPAIVIVCCWCGEQHAGAKALEPLRVLLRAEADLIAALPYPIWQGSMDATAPYGMRNYWRSTCLPALDDSAIDWIAARCLDLPSALSTMTVHHLQGSVSQPGGDAADDLRPYPFVVNVRATWPSAQHDAATIEWVRRCSAGLAPGYPRRAYVNFSDGNTGGEDAELSFAPEALARLRRTKRLYDPDSMFI
jgi:FAD/FMN-containing dehydrogenase